MNKLLLSLLGLAFLAGCASETPRNPMNKECDAQCDVAPDTSIQIARLSTCIVFEDGHMHHAILASNTKNVWCTDCNLDLDNDGYMDAIANVPSER